MILVGKMFELLTYDTGVIIWFTKNLCFCGHGARILCVSKKWNNYFFSSKVFVEFKYFIGLYKSIWTKFSYKLVVGYNQFLLSKVVASNKKKKVVKIHIQ